jgi:DNA polymerase III subunit beta
MRLNVDRNTLLEPLQMVMGVVEKKQTLPILSHVLLNIKNQRLEVIGTDTEVELMGQMPLIDHNEANQITVPGRKLMDICRALPEDSQIQVACENEKLVLKSGRSRFTLTTLPASEFPNIDLMDDKTTFQMNQQDLLQLFSQTYFAIAQQDVRYYLNGLLFELHPNMIRAVATDGHRLALSELHASIGDIEKTSVIIPRKGILELMRLLDASDVPVTIHLSANHIQVIGDHFTFTSKLIEGRFPDYERVIPRDGNKSFIIEKDTLKGALQRAAILCNEKFKGVRLELAPNLLRLLSNNPEHEAAEEELTIDYNDEAIDIGFNVVYVQDVLNTIKSEHIKLTFTNSNSSVLLEDNEGDGNTIFVIMPMRL